MLKLLQFLFILFLGVISSACMNTVAVHELNQKAAKYLEDGDVDKAISRLEASIDLDGNVYESRYNLAVAYMQKNRCENALENIRVAATLEKKEPAVYYVNGIAAVCIADKIFEKEDENGEIVEVVFDTPEKQKEAFEKYKNLLTEANKSFDMYTKLAPSAEDTNQVVSLMDENKKKIEEKSAALDSQT